MKKLGQEFSPGMARKSFLNDNADSVEKKGYMKKFTDEDIVDFKDNLSKTDIQINDIEEEKKEVVNVFKLKLKPLQTQRQKLLKDLKHKAEFVTEECYKFIDNETRMVEYYNVEGELIETRPANADELQRNIFQDIRKNGTENK
ncbi:MAG: hypothetical protein WC720_05205 [Candidatus Shapirobacteria bacterium]|jgi:hypothetical protein